MKLTNFIVSLLVVAALFAFSVSVATARDVPIMEKSKIVKIDKATTGVTATINQTVSESAESVPISTEYQPATITACTNSKRGVDVRTAQPEIVLLQ